MHLLMSMLLCPLIHNPSYLHSSPVAPNQSLDLIIVLSIRMRHYQYHHQSTKAGLVEKYVLVPEVIPKNEEYAHIQSKFNLPTSVRHSSLCTCMSDWLSSYLSDCVSVWQTVCEFKWLAGCVFVYLSDWLAACEPVCVYDWLTVCLSDWLTDWLCVCCSVCCVVLCCVVLCWCEPTRIQCTC